MAQSQKVVARKNLTATITVNRVVNHLLSLLNLHRKKLQTHVIDALARIIVTGDATSTQMLLFAEQSRAVAPCSLIRRSYHHFAGW